MLYREVNDDENSYKNEIKRLVQLDDTEMANKFVMPPLGIKPNVFVKKHFGPNTRLPMAQFLKGTTTLSFLYKPKTQNDKGGIILAVDSRATGGAFISSKTVEKVIPINNRMVATMAGGAADCQYWTRVVSKYCNLFELRESSQISVAAASKYFANVMYEYRGKELAVHSMVCGIDKSGPSIYLVQDEGSRLKVDKMCALGSGMLNALAILDNKYKETMSDEEAYELGREAVVHATFRDGASGGRCNLCHISFDGMKRFPPIDVSDKYYEMMQQKGNPIVPEIFT